MVWYDASRVDGDGKNGTRFSERSVPSPIPAITPTCNIGLRHCALQASSRVEPIPTGFLLTTTASCYGVTAVCRSMKNEGTDADQFDRSGPRGEQIGSYRVRLVLIRVRSHQISGINRIFAHPFVSALKRSMTRFRSKKHRSGNRELFGFPRHCYCLFRDDNRPVKSNSAASSPDAQSLMVPEIVTLSWTVRASNLAR